MELFIKNIPFFSIMLSMFAGIVTIPVKKGKTAFWITFFIESAVLLLSLILFVYLAKTNEVITFSMGHFPAPWGNEIRAGVLETLMATLFSGVMLFSVVSGNSDIMADILPNKLGLYFIAFDELFGAMIALIYTNDLFTAYVFIEISMLGASAIIMAKSSGRSLIATLRYLIMMLVGSGLFLLGVIILYSITGHLLMPNLGTAVQAIISEGTYKNALLCVIGLVCLGLSIKSAVFPFHTILPGAHSVATTTSSAVLSGLVLKAYIFLLIKCITRIFSIEVMVESGFSDIALLLGCVGTIACSLMALRETDLKRMIAYSSSAQIGYIFIGIGLMGTNGLVAACLHIIVHAIAKSTMFISAGSLASACGHQTDGFKLRGSAHINKLAGLGFTFAGLSMIGLPFFPGFASKLYLAMAAYGNTKLFVTVLVTLLISMILNAMYFVPAIIAIWSEPDDKAVNKDYKSPKTLTVSLIAALVVMLLLGLFFKPLADIIARGLSCL